MNERAWAAWCGDPGELFNVVRHTVSDRKLRLFACACAREVQHLLSDVRSARALETGELFADGLVTAEEAETRSGEATAAVSDAAEAHGTFSAAVDLAVAARYTLARSGLIAFAAANRAACAVGAAKTEAQSTQCVLFRDILGNPYRPSAFDPRWLTPTVTALAGAIYAGRAFDRMPILADALEEAGCDSTDVLNHCRGGGVHARGCWVLDLVLERE